MKGTIALSPGPLTVSGILAVYSKLGQGVFETPSADMPAAG